MPIHCQHMLGQYARRFVIALLLNGFAAGAQGTILTFDQMRDSTAGNPVIPTTSGASVEPDYGDRVGASPQAVPGGEFTYGNAGEGFTLNVVTEIFDGRLIGTPGANLWQEEYGDLMNVVFGNNNSVSLNVRLTADPGFNVLLYHFDLGGWPETDYTIHEVRVTDGDTTLFSQGDVVVQGDFDGPRHTPFDFATPLSGSVLLIEIDYSNLPGGNHDSIGIDNIRFGQDPPPIPEPASLASLLMLGLLLAAYRPRRGRPPHDPSMDVYQPRSG